MTLSEVGLKISQSQYLKVVEQLASKHGVGMSKDLKYCPSRKLMSHTTLLPSNRMVGITCGFCGSVKAITNVKCRGFLPFFNFPPICAVVSTTFQT